MNDMIADLHTLDASLVSEDFIRDPYRLWTSFARQTPFTGASRLADGCSRAMTMLWSLHEVASYFPMRDAWGAHPPISRRNPGTTERLRGALPHQALIHSDPPDHTRLRKLVQTGSPRGPLSAAPADPEIVDDLIDRWRRREAWRSSRTLLSRYPSPSSPPARRPHLR